MACVDFGNSLGFSGRSRFYQIIQGRVKSLDCSERWEPSWLILGGSRFRDGWSERVHFDL